MDNQSQCSYRIHPCFITLFDRACPPFHSVVSNWGAVFAPLDGSNRHDGTPGSCLGFPVCCIHVAFVVVLWRSTVLSRPSNVITIAHVDAGWMDSILGDCISHVSD